MRNLVIPAALVAAAALGWHWLTNRRPEECPSGIIQTPFRKPDAPMDTSRIDEIANDALSADEAISHLLGGDGVLIDAVRYYAALFARFQLERVYASLARDGHYSAARATEAQIEALLEADRERTRESF